MKKENTPLYYLTLLTDICVGNDREELLAPKTLPFVLFELQEDKRLTGENAKIYSYYRRKIGLILELLDKETKFYGFVGEMVDKQRSNFKKKKRGN